MASTAERSAMSAMIASSLSVTFCTRRISVRRRRRQFARRPSRTAVPMAPAAPVISTRSVVGSIMNVLLYGNRSGTQANETGQQDRVTTSEPGRSGVQPEYNPSGEFKIVWADLDVLCGSVNVAEMPLQRAGFVNRRATGRVV